MMKLLACIAGCGALVGGARISRKKRSGSQKVAAEAADIFSVECQYERMALMLEAGGEVEVGECVDREGNVFDVNPEEVDWAEHHDVLSLQLQEVATVSILGEREYKVLSASLVSLAEEVSSSGPSMASSGYSILAVSSVWNDGASATTSQIRANLDQAKDLIKKSSYGTFNIGATTKYVTTTVRSKYSAHDGTCNARSIREQIIPRTSGVNNYMYRMFFIPGVKGCGWAGLATVGCGRPGNSPRNGACWSMYHGGSNFGHSIITQAHELGHNFGLLHAAGLRRGNFVEYGDDTAIMGNVWKAGMQFSAAHRLQIGWLRNTAGEVVQLSRGARRLSKLEGAKGTAGAVALRIPCSRCVPRQSNKASQVGGEIFVSYALSRVRVHLRRVNSKGVFNQGQELWATMAAGESFSNRYGPSVHVCGLGTNAKVSVGTSVSDAKSMCR